MMKKVFISLPMGGMNEKEIRELMEYLFGVIKKLYTLDGDNFQLIQSFITWLPKNANRQDYIRESLKLMLDADFVVFAGAWRDAIGCCQEFQVSKIAGLKTFELVDLSLKPLA